MIVVTVGTNEQPFDRLVRAAAELDLNEPLVVQHGASRVPHGRGRWLEMIPFDELSALMTEARIVVCHAGVGSIVQARRCGHQPIVVPRRFHLKEAVDDHQLPLARRLDSTGMVRLLEDEQRLANAVTGVGRMDPGAATGTHPLPGADALARELRDYLEGLRAA